MADESVPPRMSDSAEVPALDVTINLTYATKPHKFSFPSSATMSDLAATVESVLSIPASSQKFIVPTLGLLRHPFPEPVLSLSTLQDKKIMLLGSTAATLASYKAASTLASGREASHARALAQRASRPSPSRRGPDPHAQHTFLTLRPLSGLPHPERSLAFLERLRDDPGIKAVMRAHRFTVGLLTEMEPLSNTSVSTEGISRLLGLNRNGGEVIELRLRTDVGDGYRDYKTVRNTLCHELAHNVHGPHDAAFWQLCGRIEREVEAGNSGRSLGENEGTTAPAREWRGDAVDHGGWAGGEFVLGGRRPEDKNGAPLTRREILAQAAEERLRRAREGGGEAQEQAGPQR